MWNPKRNPLPLSDIWKECHQALMLMNKEELYAHIVALLKQCDPVIKNDYIFFMKDYFLYHISTDPTVSTIQLIVRRQLDDELDISSVTTIVNELNTKSANSCHLIEDSTYVFRRTVPIKSILVDQYSFTLFFKDVELQSEAGYDEISNSTPRMKKTHIPTKILLTQERTTNYSS